MARILFVTQYYPPESGAAANVIGDFATMLARRGHEVTVLTGLPSYPLGVVPPEYRDKRRRDEVVNGVRVVRVWSVIRPNTGFFTRITGMVSFGMLAGLLGARKVGKQDVVIAVSPPLFTCIAGRRLARKNRAPLVFNCQDLWPESAVKLGALSNKLFIWLAERLEWSTYRRARTVWLVTEGQQETLLHRGLAPSKILTLRLGVNMSRFGRQDQAAARAELGWNEGFYVLQSGTIGLTLDTDTLLGAAELLRDQSDIRIMLAGDGAERPRLESEAQRRGLTNVVFLGMQPLDRLATIISASDVSLINYRKLSFFQGTLPSRMYEAMASARPILLAADGIARKLAIDEAGAGLYVEPGSAQALAEAIRHLRDHPELTRQLGAQGRAYADVVFNREKMAEQLDMHLRALMDRKGSGRAAEIPSVAVTTRE